MLTELDTLNQHPTLRYSDEWAELIRELVLLGPTAVPELIDELDQTQDDHMLRCLAFILRGIDDPRAVPALIRAIPKTLAPPRSDMGLHADDPELLAFMRKHDLDTENRDDGYSFGRSVREVFGALHALTEHTESDEELFLSHRFDFAARASLQEQLFHRKAANWQQWWETHWSEFLSDKTYSQVNLPEPPVARPTPHIEAETQLRQGLDFGDSILHSARHGQVRHGVFYDLDTMRQAGIPEPWKDQQLDEKQMQELIAWASGEGFDLMCDEYVTEDGTRIPAIRGLDLNMWRLERPDWNSEIDNVRIDHLQRHGQVGGDWLLHRNQQSGLIEPQATTYFFVMTREGCPAVIYIGRTIDSDLRQFVKGTPGPRDENDFVTTEWNPSGYIRGRYYRFAELGPAASE